MEIVFAGFGGQGVLKAGLIVAEMALHEDKNVTWMPAYGPSMRGGKAYSVVKYSDEEIGGPDMESIDILVAMNEPSLSYTSLLKEGGTVIINADNVSDDVEVDPMLNVIRLPFLDMAMSVDNAKGATIVAIGAMTKACDLFPLDSAKESLRDIFAKKGKAKFAELNEKAFILGYESVEKF